MLFALMAYGAIILSFLGGIHWGLAIGAVPQTDNTLWRRIALSILPSLVAWAALLTPSSIGCLVLAAPRLFYLEMASGVQELLCSERIALLAHQEFVHAACSGRAKILYEMASHDCGKRFSRFAFDNRS